MEPKLYEFVSKLHNELIDRLGIDADKYEREDCFFGVLHDLASGKDMKEAFVESFDGVYGMELTDSMYGSCYAVCKGFRNWE